MKRFFAVFALFSLCLSAEQQNLRFDAASLKPLAKRVAAAGNTAQEISVAMSQLNMGGVAGRKIPRPDPGRVVIRRASVLAIVAMAYRVSTTQVRGPGWMEDDDYEVIATVPPAHGEEDDVRLMLQLLLKERFGLAVRHEEKNLPGYELLAERGGAKLQKARAEPSDAAMPAAKVVAQRAAFASDLNRKASAAGKNAVIAYPGITVDAFTARLTQLLQAPVQNATRIQGLYDFTLYSTYAQMAESPHDAVGQALEPLGLKLSPKRVLTDILVIDKAERKPKPN